MSQYDEIRSVLFRHITAAGSMPAVRSESEIEVVSMLSGKAAQKTSQYFTH